jgi:hypothetical protein
MLCTNDALIEATRTLDRTRTVRFCDEGAHEAQPTKKPLARPFLYEDGAGGRNRTADLFITNELLYQLSYTGNCLSKFDLRQAQEYISYYISLEYLEP